MLTITIQVNAPSGQAIGIKEDIAAYLEKFGDASVYSARHHRCGRGCGGSCSEKAPLQRGESSRRHDRND